MHNPCIDTVSRFVSLTMATIIYLLQQFSVNEIRQRFSETLAVTALIASSYVETRIYTIYVLIVFANVPDWLISCLGIHLKCGKVGGGLWKRRLSRGVHCSLPPPSPNVCIRGCWVEFIGARVGCLATDKCTRLCEANPRVSWTSGSWMVGWSFG